MKRHLFILIIAIWQCLFGINLYAVSDNYTIIVSMDAFRWDYPDMYNTPFFDEVGDNGVKAIMKPSFPSKTFPNHYTLATGLYPDHHGIVANSFWDKANDAVYSLGNKETRDNVNYYGGEPIWITAMKQGMTVATIYWVGSDIPICGKYPNYYHNYRDKLLTYDERVDRVLELLQKPNKERPRFIMLYFDQPDHNGHVYGPQSKKTRGIIENLDSLLCGMWQRIKALPIGDKVNLILTSDHGMAALAPQRYVDLTKVLKPEWYDKMIGDLPTFIYTKDGCRDSVLTALQSVDHIKYWKRENMPEYLHFGTNERIGDIVVLTDIGWIVTDKPVKMCGTHGFDPEMSDMQVMFRAIGPDFKSGYVKPDRFPNVDIYVMLAHLLGIEPAQTEGDIHQVEDLFNPKRSLDRK